MVTEEVIVELSGGAPWGFRLQGGVEHQKPLQVAKVRKRSKACRAGLQEADELVSINDQPCGTLSHAQAMTIIDSSPGILHIRVKRAPVGFQSVVLVTRAPSPRIDKEYRASLRVLSPTNTHHAPVREVHRSRSSLTSGLTSPPGSEAYYGETDSDADVAGYERQRRQKRRSPSNSTPGKPSGRASPEDGCGGEGNGGEGLPGVARKEVIYQPPGPGIWSSQTSTETSSIISSADDQGPRDAGQEEDSGFLEPSNVPLVSPERAKEALMLSSRSQMVPMVGPLSKPIDEELSTTYMEKAKQAKLNRGDTLQDKHVKEAKSKCRTIASLLTDAPNPHSKGVLMFKKRRQRSKKYTLTSFGSIDEDRCQDSQEEDGVFPGSESEIDDDSFSAAPDPTWDSDYLDMLEKRATAGTEGREDGTEITTSPGLSNTTGKGAQLFEQQRKRAAEHAKKAEVAQPQVLPQTQVQEHSQMSQFKVEMQAQLQSNLQQQHTNSPGHSSQQQTLSDTLGPVTATAHNGDLSYSEANAINTVISPPPVAPKPSTASVALLVNPAPPSETPLPELPGGNVLNRTARPFTPGFISIRAATAPVTFRPPVTKTAQRPVSAVVVQPTLSTHSEMASNAPPAAQQVLPSPSLVYSHPSSALISTFTPKLEAHPPAISTSMDIMQRSQPIPSPHQAQLGSTALVPAPFMQPIQHLTMAPTFHSPIPQTSVTTNSAIPQPSLHAPIPQSPSPQISMTPVTPASMISQPAVVPPATNSGPAGRTGILLDARRRGGKPKPMFNVPEVKKNSPNPDLLCLVQNLDDRSTRYRQNQPQDEAIYDGAQEEYGEADTGRAPPPVAPKPRVIHEVPQIMQAGGKGAQLFAKRQSRMGRYVVETPPEMPYQQTITSHGAVQPFDSSQSPSLPCQWKYSPNVRAPPPIGYNPLLAPSIPLGPQRDTSKPESHGRGSSQKEGIKAIDFMRRQPYQLNSAMFNYGGSASNLSPIAPYQPQQGDYTRRMVGSSLTSPKQIPVKTARVYEIKRFSTPTPMSAPTLAPKVIAPRSATTLGERLSGSDMTSPPPVAPAFPSTPFQQTGIPNLPKFSSTPINPVPPTVATPYSPAFYTGGLQTAKQFQSAPELSILASLPPLKSTTVQAPKPHFVATKAGIQPRVWRPGAI
ncbi:synaptopodin 2-like protein isoform X2 [Gouania willdenowi]|uniref:synaptopodin 2-like protein isoform X2 n=1 Tax=Gouania willdenowi TaxID=441366 RepID=UPI0010550578|nr:synaptopodin 2-like protein isoform X2 [Gouania willdenowi]